MMAIEEHTYDGYLELRRVEASASCAAALQLAGIQVTAEEVRRVAKRAAGRYSDISVMDAVSDFFRAGEFR